jgi:hypothetical protein
VLRTVLALGIVATTNLLFGATVQADVLYSQSLNNSTAPGGGGPFSNNPGQIIADMFSISSGGTIDQVSWYGASLSGVPFSQFDITFYGNNAGVPGTALYSFVGTPTIVSTGLTDSYGDPVLSFTMNIPAFVAAPGTTYYFSTTDMGTFNFVWASSNLASGGFVEQNGTPPWGSLSTDSARASQAFSLNDVVTPVPAALPLFATGLGGLGLLGWRRKRKAQGGENAFQA